MNKKELIEKIKRLRDGYPVDESHEGVRQGLLIAIGMIGQLLEPTEAESVIVPKFVADWYENEKEDLEFGIYSLMSAVDRKHQVEHSQIEDWANEGTTNKAAETLIKMKLFGYEVEKEKLYYTVDEKGQTLLLKSEEGIIRSNGTDLEIVLSVYENAPSNMYQLTEKEIKDYDERYWLFAVEVAE